MPSTLAAVATRRSVAIASCAPAPSAGPSIAAITGWGIRRIAGTRSARIDIERVAIRVSVPIHFLNEESCFGVKMEGGIVQHQVTDIEVSCLPGDIPEYVEVDMLEVKIGDIIHLSDIPLPEGVTSVALALGEDHDLAVASIIAPRGGAEAEEELEAAADEAGDEAADGDDEGGDEEGAAGSDLRVDEGHLLLEYDASERRESGTAVPERRLTVHLHDAGKGFVSPCERGYAEPKADALESLRWIGYWHAL